MINRLLKVIMIMLSSFWFLMIITYQVKVVSAQTEYPIKEFRCQVIPNPGGETTKIKITFQTSEYLKTLKVSITFEKDGEYITENPFEMGQNNNNCEFKETFDDSNYRYYLSFDAISGKVGDIQLNFEYKTGNNNYQQSFFIYTGNSTINDYYFTTSAAIFIGSIVSLTSAIATYFIISYNEQGPLMNREEQDG